MNKTTSIVLVVVILLLLGGGIYYYNRESTSQGTVATSTPTGNNTGNNNNGSTNPPVAGAPTAVTSSSVAPSDTTAIVNGTVNPKGAFTSYWYEYGTSSNLGSKTANQTLGSGFVTIQAPGYIVGLTKSTTYYLRLVSENQYGRVAGATYSFRTTDGTPPPVGSAPTAKTLSATGISRTTANLNGEVTPNKADTQYWFEYGKTVELGNTSVFSHGGNGSAKTAVSMSLSDLDPLTTYYFRLNAQNQFGTINGSILNFKTLGPTGAAAPTIVTQSATALASTSATLHGTVNPNGAETTYWFEYSTDSLLGSILLNTTDEIVLPASSNTSSVAANISDLKSNTTYYFRLVGQNSQGTVRGAKMTFKTK